jgi:hypothetical protein
LLDQEYKTLHFPFPEIQPPSIEMRFEWELRDLVGYLSTWSAVENYRKLCDSDPVMPFAAELAPHWQERRVVRWPVYIRAAHIHPRG